jgi:hypothetical protein
MGFLLISYFILEDIAQADKTRGQLPSYDKVVMEISTAVGIHISSTYSVAREKSDNPCER